MVTLLLYHKNISISIDFTIFLQPLFIWNSHVLSLVCQHTVKATTFVMNEWFLQCCFSYGHSQLLWIFARSLAL
jgi:hypothetical protein